MKKRWIATVTACVLLLSAVSGIAASFDDVTEAHAWAKAEIENYAERGILAGDGKGHFLPDNSVTRAEFAKMLCLVFGLEEAEALAYADVSKDSWQYDYIAKTDKYTYTESKEKYAPDAQATRAEIAYAIVAAAGLTADKTELPFDDVDEILPELSENAAVAYALGLLKGYPDNTFRPNAPVTRAEAVVLLSRAEAALSEKPPVEEETKPLPDNEAVKLEVTQLHDFTDEIEEMNTLACVRSVIQEVYLPGHQQPKACIKLYLSDREELGCVFMDELAVYKNGTRSNSALDCGDLVYFEKKFNGTISKVHILWDMNDKGKKNGNDYIYTNVGYNPNTDKKSDVRFWGGRGTLDSNGKRATNEFRIMYAPNMVPGEKKVNIGGYSIPADTRVLIYSRYKKSSERYRSALIGELNLTNPERKEIFNSIVNTPENLKLVKTFYLHWTAYKLKDIIVVQDVQFE